MKIIFCLQCSSSTSVQTMNNYHSSSLHNTVDLVEAKELFSLGLALIFPFLSQSNTK